MTEEMGEPLKSVTIEAQEDGSFLVGTEPAAEATEMPEGSMGDMTEDQGEGMQPAASLDEALDLARQMLQDNGMSEEESVMAGYNQAKPQSMNKPSPAKVFGGM